MRRVFAVAAAATSLAGCSSFSMDNFNYFQSTPPEVQLQLESAPPGAEARTSVGPGCKTPCSVSVTAPEGGFTVSYSLARHQPATVPVQVIRTPGDLLTSGTTKIEPNPVVAELKPITPPKANKPMRPKRPKSTTAAAPAAESAFPDPAQGVPPPPGSSTR